MVLSIMALLLIAFALSWSRAQAEAPETTFSQILTHAGIEWGAWISLIGAHLKPIASFYEAPPLNDSKGHPRQIPIIFIPSLHSSPRIFGMLIWRLRKNFCTSLWPFAWKPFIRDELFLKKFLLQHIQDIIARTKSRKINIVSFGTSRPVISKLLEEPQLRDIQFKWIAISAPAHRSPTLRFISSDRIKNTFSESPASSREPDLLIRGSHDFFCYPESVWGTGASIVIEPMGHYSTLLHSKTTQTILEFFEMKYDSALRHG